MEKRLQQAENDRAGALEVAAGARQRDVARDGRLRAQDEGWKRADQRDHDRAEPAVTEDALRVENDVSGDVRSVQG